MTPLVRDRHGSILAACQECAQFVVVDFRSALRDEGYLRIHNDVHGRLCRAPSWQAMPRFEPNERLPSLR